MNLSKLLSKPAMETFTRVDTFWLENDDNFDCEDDEGILQIGQHINLDIGQVSLNYYCDECENLRTFNSNKAHGMRGVVVSRRMLSIDCVLCCGCESVVHTWFLIEAEEDIRYQSPMVRILHFREKLSDGVRLQFEQYGDLSNLLEKARRAFRDELGAGAVIYLRKAFEALTYGIATSSEIPIPVYKDNGWRRSFKGILQEVDEKHSIIPRDFEVDRYELYSKLSDIIHGDGKEEDALMYFGVLYTLVTSIISNVELKKQYQAAAQKFNNSDNSS